ncbi:HAD family phosphatase [candidate division KSB1 bacterium]|nr:HAD family phosphatase [candidate division KSB1 bacterium]RQW00624.1 MAG: HAD family phosphatase [candidate division KSB1 bacterium]
MIKNIIFDNDGVLVDTEKLFFQACRQTLEHIGVELTLEAYLDVSLRQGKSCMILAEKIGYTHAQIQQLRLDRDVTYRELLNSSVTMLAGVQNVLDALYGKICMGVVTSSPRLHFDIIHAQTGIAPYFNFVYAQEDFTRLKPFPDPYLLALEKQHLRADETIVIEDTERGLASALAAGIRCIVVPTEISRGCEFKGAFRILDRIDEIVDIVTENESA